MDDGLFPHGGVGQVYSRGGDYWLYQWDCRADWDFANQGFLGLDIEGKVPAEFFGLLETLWQALPTWNPAAFFIALLSLAIIIGWQLRVPTKLGPNGERASALNRIRASIPGSIIALVVATVLVQVLGLNVATIGSRFGGIPQGLPSFTIPLPMQADGSFSMALLWSTMKGLAAPAVTLAVLGAIESLLCARVADNMIRDKHDPNQELLSQGFANMVVPFLAACLRQVQLRAR